MEQEEHNGYSETVAAWRRSRRSRCFAALGADAKDAKKVGLAVANLQANFFNQIKESVEAEGAEKGIKVITVDAKGDAATQVNQIQDLLAQNIDALIYIPAGATAASVPVKAAKAAGVPVVNIDRNADGAPGDTFIATDSVEFGAPGLRLDRQAGRRQG